MNSSTTPHTAPTSVPPSPAPPRFLTPDLARGVMLAPIAVANVMLYLHARPFGLRQHILTDSAWDQIVTALMTAVVDARAYPLFAALFGYGLVQMARRRRARGVSDEGVARVVRRRSLALIAFGGVHALLAFSGDILGFYGLLGLLTVRLLRLSDRPLWWLAGSWLVLASAVQGFIFAAPPGHFEGTIFASFAIADPLEAAFWRMIEWLMAPFGLLAVVSALLVGTWAARHRILEHPEQHIPLLRRMAVVGISIGILGGVGMALATAQVISPPYPVLFALSWLHILSGVFAGLGYAALTALTAVRLQRRGREDSLVVRALSATGQRSLSAYLAQSVVFAALLPASTLGWGATTGPAGAAALALAVWAGTVVAAAMLARRGRPGPAEALLRRLTSAAQTPTSRATIG